MHTKYIRWGVLSLILLLGLLAGPLSAAEPPKITIAPIWRPGATLDSIDSAPLGTKDSGDDFRYVDVDIYVTTTVQFWSVQLTCTASPAALTSYADAASDGDPDNTVAPVIWGPAWTANGGTFTSVEDPYNPTTGARTITAARLGNGYPMGGGNGVRDIFLIATLRYRVKDIAANTTATFTCTSTFLNRNGNPVLVATYAPPPALPVITGYTVSGMALYQGRTMHTGITVACDYGADGAGPNDFSVLTSATGAWSKTTRAQGYYACNFYGDTTPPITTTPKTAYERDRYLAAGTTFDLKGLSYTMLPVTLLGGNVSYDGSPSTANETVDFINDITLLTGPAYWNKAATAAAGNLNGDINGDGKISQTDFTIAAANFDSKEITDVSHILYGMARDYDVWQHMRIWLGGVQAGTTTSFMATPAGEVRDMWPTVSPDGKTLAFIRNIVDGSAATPEMGLYTAPLTNGIAGTPTLITPANADYMALAPS